jgi:16S rRNA (guanine966-N2)-methyltransferase
LTSLGAEAQVHAITARAFLERARASGRQYDLVFVDPPYRQAGVLGPELSAALPAVLAPGARVVAESDRRAPLNLELPLFTERRYGDTLISIHDT